MKILYCIHSTYNSGGMERILSEKANYLADILNYEITIVTTEQQGQPHFYRFSEKIKFLDLNINYDTSSEGCIVKRFTSRLRKQHEHRKLLTNHLLSSHYDVVISMFEREAAFLYKIKDGSKKCLELHFSRFVRSQRNPKGLKNVIAHIMGYLDGIYARHYDRFIVLTNEDKGYWKHCTNIQVIPNPAIQYNGVISPLTNKQVTAIGRLDYQKGYDSLIRTWSKVYNVCPEWKLQIYGSGVLSDELKKNISDLKLENSIFINPPTDHIEDVYAQSSIVVSSSHYEGFPLVLLESISCGIPIVSYSYKCGPKDLIDDGINGFLVDAGNEKILADRIITLIRNERLRHEMGKNAFIKSQDFSLDNIMLKWHKLFQSLI